MNGGVEAKGIVISSDVEISVVLDYYDEEFVPRRDEDMTAIEPISSSQTEYYVMNYFGGSNNCRSDLNKQFYAVSAAVDGTAITVTTPGGSSSVYNMNQFDTYSEVSSSGTTDYTGIHIESNEPVTLIAGKICATFNGAYGSYISSQTPVADYESEYHVPYIYQPSSMGYAAQVMAAYDNTNVDVEGNSYSIDAGDDIFLSYPSRNTGTLINCTQPCNVVQYTIGLQESVAMFSTSVVATEDFDTSAYFTTKALTYTFYITVVVASSEPVFDLLLDGQAFNPTWNTAGDYIYADTSVAIGSHVMNSTFGSLFAVYTYSHYGREAGGYGYAVLPSRGETCSY